MASERKFPSDGNDQFEQQAVFALTLPVSRRDEVTKKKFKRPEEECKNPEFCILSIFPVGSYLGWAIIICEGRFNAAL